MVTIDGFTIDDDIRNRYYEVPQYPDVTHLDIVYMYEQVQVSTKVFVDTCFVSKLVNFIWFNLKTNHSSYYIGKPRNRAGRELLKPLNRRRIELHTLIAIIANIPNPNNYLYVEHIKCTEDNRIENLNWSSNKPYKFKRGDLPYPDDVGNSENNPHITWHLSYFKVSHPILRKKMWTTSKTTEFTNQQKFEQAKNKLEELCLLKSCPNNDKELEKFNELIDEYEQSV